MDINEELLYDFAGITALAAAGIAAVVALMALALGIVKYVFRSIGLYQIARRRGIPNPWLAWIPFLHPWIAGSIADHYESVVWHKNRCYRVIMLVLGLILPVVGLSGTVGSVAALTGALMGSPLVLELPVAIKIFSTTLSPLVSIGYLVIRILTYYDLYRSCDSKNGLLFTVLGALFDFLNPFFLFACRNKDDGMTGFYPHP